MPVTLPIAAARKLAGWRRGLTARRRPPVAALNLALQGGGAHGAFTWGVLDRLAEVEGLRFRAISGTSAGAVNAVVFATGWLAGGPEGARESLAELWREIARAGDPLRRSGLARMALDGPVQLLSPYQLNPLNIHPLRDLLARLVDFERLRNDRSLDLLVAATNLRTSTLRLFDNRDLSLEAVLASACLPWLHHAVEIDGEAYWDGGYLSNPPLLPLIERSEVRDLLLVRINAGSTGAGARDAPPRSASAIRSRVGDIVFDQPLARELELLEARRSAKPALSRAQRRLARHRLHVIDGRDILAMLEPSTRLVPDWPTLRHLHQMGHVAATRWLDAIG